MNNKLQNKKPLGLWSAIAIGIGGMIGAGIFSILGIATIFSCSTTLYTNPQSSSWKTPNSHFGVI